MEHLPNSEYQRQATIEIAKNFLKKHEHEVTPFHLHDLIHIFLVGGGLKPGSFITANKDEVVRTNQLLGKLGLAKRDKPLTIDENGKPSGKSYEIAQDQARIDDYEEAENKIPNTDNPILSTAWNRTNGEFLGYPQSSIDAYITYEQNYPIQHQFWQMIEKGATASDDIALAMEATDVIPVTPDDPDVAAWGKEIRAFLDEIDPTLSERFTQWGQHHINEERPRH